MDNSTARPQTRARIVEAAIAVLNEHGFSELTQTRVARELGLRQSNVTYHFPKRSDLLRAAIEAGCEQLLDRIAGLQESRPASIESMREVMAKELTMRTHSRLMTSMTVASDEMPELKRWLGSFESRILNRLRTRFAALGLMPRPLDLQLFHAAVAGAIHLDLGVGTPASQLRARRTIRAAFNRLVADCRAGRETVR